MNNLKAYLAGIALPTTIIPLLLYIAVSLGKGELLTFPLLHMIPILWGIWNVLYFTLFKEILPANHTVRMLITGAVLGFIVAALGVFWLHIPQIVGFHEKIHYLPLVIGPILYAILWLYVVDPLNKLLGIN